MQFSIEGVKLSIGRIDQPSHIVKDLVIVATVVKNNGSEFETPG